MASKPTPSNPPLPAPPDDDLASYTQAHHLLSLAAHRNKNQHGHARWWSALGMLRRALGRLVADLEVLDGPGVAGPGSGFGSGGGVREGEAMGMGRRRLKGRERREVVARVEARKAWMRTVLVGRCWVSFSAVVADNQYSALGLMLLGTLARVNRLLGPGEDSDSETDVEHAALRLERDRRTAANEIGIANVAGVDLDPNMDLGEKVSRQDMDLDVDMAIEGAVLETKKDLEMDTGESTANASGDIGLDVAEEKLEKKALHAQRRRTRASPSPPPKKRKKKQKKGDAIDALFAGLA